MGAMDEAAKRIRLLLLDVDGVLTDGGIHVGADGSESKRFHVHDGLAIAWWRRLGRTTAILSGRSSPAVDARASELGIEHVAQGIGDKRARFRELLDELGLSPDEVCFVGDDLPDLPVLAEVGFPAAPSNAVREVREAVRYVSARPGGGGAVREIVEHLLAGSRGWDSVVEHHRP